jgi:hypothetical protein
MIGSEEIAAWLGLADCARELSDTVSDPTFSREPSPIVFAVQRRHEIGLEVWRGARCLA